MFVRNSLEIAQKSLFFVICNWVCDMKIQTNGFNNGEKTSENNTQMNEFEQRGQKKTKAKQKENNENKTQ